MKFFTPIAALSSAFLFLTMIGCSEPSKSQAQATLASHSKQPNGPQKAIVVIISPDDDESRLKLVKRAFFDALEVAEPKVRWHVLWSSNKDHVVSFDIPDAYGLKRRRELRSILPRIHAAFDKKEPNADGQVDLPGLSASVAKQLTTETECRIAIYGSPCYLNEDQDAFQHNVVYVTKDGSIDYELSPFQTETQLPRSCQVVWVIPQNNFGYDTKHEAAIRHFNGFYIQKLGGRLLRTTDDVTSMFNFEAPETFNRLVMKHDSPGKYPATVKTVGEGDDGIQTVEFHQEDFMAPGDGLENSPETVLSTAEEDKDTIALAINWYCEDPSCDIDMWLASNGLSGELYFNNQKTDWGRHFRDVTSSTSEPLDVNSFKNWEWIRVDHARLHDLVLHLNVFRTTAPARVTIVRVWNGERRTRVVELNVTKGDEGKNRNNRRASKAWQRISLYSITDPDEL